MSTEHRRPLFAFVAVFVVAMLVVAGAARSDAFRDLVRERSVDIVAATMLDLVGQPEPRLVVAAQEVDASGAETVGSPASSARVAAKGKAAREGQAVRAGKAHAHAQAPGKAKGHDKSGHPGRAKGHDKSGGKSKGKSGR